MKIINSQTEQYLETPEEKEKRLAFEKELNHLYNQITKAAKLDPDKRQEEFAKIQKIANEYKRVSAKNRREYQLYNAAADELEARMHDINSSIKKKHALFRPAPANSVIDMEEKRNHSFARGNNIYKLLLLLFIGSFAGVVIETIYCVIQNGYIESRQGLVWGPFNLLYGLGAVALTATLYRYRNRSSLISFLGGMIVGSVLEYLCSFFQELLIGSVSWDYSKMPFNIDGRICLLYSVFWGVLGVIWIKHIYPRIAILILKISNKIGKILVWAMTIFLLVDSLVSCVAVSRWIQRRKDIAAKDPIAEYFDVNYPDSRMESIYANMTFGD